MGTELRAFHGDPKIKEKYLARVKAHRAADQIIHGTYWDKGKGCAVGCTIHSGNHRAYESELGIPTWLAYLEDQLFEAMANGRAKDWPVEFIEAIPVGADLTLVLNQFMAWLMVDEKWGVANVTEDAEVKDLCREVARRYLAEETTGPEADALAARLRATASDRDRAARAAWEAWAAREAWEAWEAAYQNFVSASADEVLGMLRAAPVPAEIGA